MKKHGKRYVYGASIWARAPYTARENPLRPGVWQVLHPRGTVLKDNLTEVEAKGTAAEWNKISGKSV